MNSFDIMHYYKLFYKNNMEENKIESKVGNSPIQEMKSGRKSNRLEKVSYISLLVSTFLLPLFFIPSKFIVSDSDKVLVMVIGVFVALIFWILSKIKEGKLEFPATLFYSSALFVTFVYFLSSIFSVNKINSLIGYGFELGTFGLVFIGFALMFLSSSVFRTKDKIFYSYIALFISFVAIFIFQTGKLLFGADFLSFGIFNGVTSNMIGKWNDLGIYFGLVAILSIVTLELTKLGKLMRFFFFFASIVSLFFISLINFKFIWFVIGSFAVLFFIYSISSRRGSANNARNLSSDTKKVSYLVLFFLIISVVFIVDGFRSKHIVGDSLAGFFKISQFEVRPSFQGTMGVLKESFKENPILGYGPNSFSNSWLLFKPNGVNNTVFWNFNFNYGVGIIPTFITTTGVLGLISWFLFFGLFLYAGFKYIFIKISNPFSRYLVISSFLAGLYLWIANIFYVSSTTLFFLAFFFTGLFIGALLNENLIPVKNFSFLGNPRRSLISMPILVIIIIGSTTGGYIYFQKFFSNFYFQKSLSLLNVAGSLDEAQAYAEKAVSFSKTDAYYRLLSDIHLARLSSLSSQNNTPKETLNAQFQSIFQNAVNSSKSAIDYDDTNYLNYLSAGRVYESVIPIEGAYKMTYDNYNSALNLNPKSPAINLILARLEVANKNTAKAKEYAIKSLQLKNNYTDAVFLLAQIEIGEGNIKDAIKLVEVGSTLTFDNPVVYFQLGILKYSDKEKDYKGAAEAFEKALTLDSSYSNARYFLGLSYYNLGKTGDAIKQFEMVQTLNPDNKEVELILKNLKAGKAPFTNALPPIDDKPEKRKELPVNEDEAELAGKR